MRRSTALALVMLGGACGGNIEQQDAENDAPGRALESSPWLVTFEQPPTGAGPLRAQRFKDHTLERTLLDPLATSTPSWSPSGRWLAYQSKPASGIGSDLWMRELAGDTWREPQLVLSARVGDAVSLPTWSPTTDQMVFEVRNRTARELFVATPREDGSIAVVRIHEGFDDWMWSPTGDRIVVSAGRGSDRRVLVQEVGRADLDWSARELVAPNDTTTFERIIPRASSGHPEGVSADGRWITVAMKGPGEDLSAPMTLHAFQTGGGEEARAMTACPLRSGDGSSEICAPWSWHPDGSKLLVVRHKRGATVGTLEAWSPDTNAHVVIGDMEPDRWIGPRSTRFMTRQLGQRAHMSIVEVRDVSAPVTAEIPTSELRSFQRALPSPDGRWLALFHSDVASTARWIEAVDLRGDPPWLHREIYRSQQPLLGNQLVWSPSSAFVLVGEHTGLEKQKRGIRIDIVTGAVTTIDCAVGPMPSNRGWSWESRMAPDDRTILLGAGGSLALLPVGSAPSGAAKLADTPEWARFSWRPSNAP